MYRDELGSRMKHNYEEPSRTRLTRRMPVTIRIDGKAFHTFTKGLKKPFDDILSNSMQKTMLELCKNIQGCVLGYTQSDEITLILIDYKTLASDAWFDYEVQKMCSISASMATNYFNKAFTKEVEKWSTQHDESLLRGDIQDNFEDIKYYVTLINCRDKGAMFDARCFNIPKEEVTNLIYWRQLDAARNSVQMLGRAYFSHSQLENKSNSAIQDMLMETYHINWNDVPTKYKRGSCAVKDENEGWIIDNEIPIFVNENRNYIESRINFE